MARGHPTSTAGSVPPLRLPLRRPTWPHAGLRGRTPSVPRVRPPRPSRLADPRGSALVLLACPVAAAPFRCPAPPSVRRRRCVPEEAGAPCPFGRVDAKARQPSPTCRACVPDAGRPLVPPRRRRGALRPSWAGPGRSGRPSRERGGAWRVGPALGARLRAPILTSWVSGLPPRPAPGTPGSLCSLPWRRK